MNAETRISEDDGLMEGCGNTHLLKDGLDGLDAFIEQKTSVERALANLAELGDETTARLANRLQQQLDTLEPSITMIGQVKAGKTSLVNAMVGWPGLLPADVNPWTSVVTSLHLSPEPSGPEDTRASFRFFEADEWGRLLEKGGRIGELASRAGHNDELEKVRVQIDHMREKSRSRLGRRFEMLLGQQHDYGTFDEELIERYVCLGDDFEDEDHSADHQGRFADITKSADLFLHRPEFPMKLCIRDTPGVNDTFMMREQITIRAIRDSRICVVVLSAHQALSSIDMALIRLISNIRSREVVIFVNRIDELSDPATQVGEIADSIRETLRKHDGPVDAQLVFGSAHWANMALRGTTDLLDAESTRSLKNWALHSEQPDFDPSDLKASAWALSGIPALYRALAERITEGVGKDALSRAARSAVNLARGVQAAAEAQAAGPDANRTLKIERAQLMDEIGRIEAAVNTAFDHVFASQIEGYHTRLDRSHRSFLERATASLIEHLDRHGESQVWKYEPTGLRLLLRSAYQVFGAKVQSSVQKVFENAAAEFGALYGRAFEGSGETLEIAPPAVAHVPPPVVIGQTIALDIQGNWWRNWWRRRRGYSAFATEFYGMIEAETNPIVDDLKTAQADGLRKEMRSILKGFLDEQRQTLVGFADQRPEKKDAGVLMLTSQDRTRSTVEDTLAALTAYAA